METRKVVIINNKTQSQKTIMSNANTLGELKAEAASAGINTEGMTWYEGHLRAEMVDEAAELPKTVMYRGQETTELTFLLTQPEKKTKSGSMSRAEAYSIIKAMGLQEVCKTKYGKNFTQCSTADLISVIEANPKKTIDEVKEMKPAKPVVEEKKEEKKETTKKAETTDCNVVNAITALVDGLYDNHKIEEELRDKVITILNGGTYTAPKKMNKREIDDMFSFVNR